MLAEIGALATADHAAAWAQQALVAKNALADADAKSVEDAFEHRVAEFTSSGSPGTGLDTAPANATSGDAGQVTVRGNAGEAVPPPGIDKSVLPLSEPRRYRSREHLRHVAWQACLICGRKPSDPHHLRYLQPRAFGRKASDLFVVPLCRIHHRALHRAGDERAWWKQAGIDPAKVARALWVQRGTEAGSDRSDPKSGTAEVATPSPAMERSDARVPPGR